MAALRAVMETLTFCAISDSRVAREVSLATRRVLYAAPGIREPVASALAAAHQRLGPGAVSIVLDTDEDTCRLGYGQIHAVRALATAGVELRQGPGLRIGLLICDDRAWSFSPVALCVESQRQSDETPNAIRLSENEAQSLANAICPVSQPGKVDPPVPQIGVQPLAERELRKVEAALEIAPPLNFDVARQVRVFQPYIQYVELRLEGCAISRHTVPIPPELLNLVGDDAVRNRLRTTFNLIGRNSSVSDSILQAEKKRLVDTFTRSLPKFGRVLLREKRTEFDKRLESLREKVQAHQDLVKEKLGREIRISVAQIAKLCLPHVMAHPPDDLFAQVVGSKPKKKEALQWLLWKLERCFPTPDEVVSEMKLECQFKDVTFETLQDEEFEKAIREAFPFVPWDKPFKAFNAARETEVQARQPSGQNGS